MLNKLWVLPQTREKKVRGNLIVYSVPLIMMNTMAMLHVVGTRGGFKEVFYEA